MSLLEKLKAAGSIKVTTLSESSLFNEKDFIPTPIPIINTAFSGRLDGGMVSGLSMIAGESKNYKSLLGLLMVKSYMMKYDDAVCLFYDSEFGVTPEYIESNGIDPDRVIHIPVEHIEQLKFDISKRLEEITRGDHVIIFIDSIGNLASKKEVEDALDEKSVADMSRAKALKSLFRIITPHFTTKNIPCIVINHVYKEIGMFPKNIVGGGCLVEGTRLIMGDGSFKEIEDIEVGEYVNTLSGPKVVTDTWNPDTLEDGTPECIELELESGITLTCSENHMFLVGNEWVEAKNLTLDMDLTNIFDLVKIKSMKRVGKLPVYDLSVADVHHYIVEDGTVTHNTGSYYSANNIFIVSRSQEKVDGEVAGWNFTLNIEKSRFVKEKSKCTFQVMYDGGLNEFSGLLDLALESGHVIKPKNGWYCREGDTKNVREKDTNTREFWGPIVTDESFKDFVKNKYMLSVRQAIEDEVNE